MLELELLSFQIANLLINSKTTANKCLAQCWFWVIRVSGHEKLLSYRRNRSSFFRNLHETPKRYLLFYRNFIKND